MNDLKKQNVLNIYIGYDEVEIVAYHTLSQSIIKHASGPVRISPICSKHFRKFFNRPRDEKQSNDFSFTRFLVPYLNNYDGYAIFMDCDMMLKTDIYEVLNEIDINKKIENAQAYICGLGYYELYLNGAKVGDHVLDPAPSNYDKQAYYVKYDITKEVAKGKNAFGIILGNGFYGQNISWNRDPESHKKGVSYGPPTVKMLVKVNYTDGTSTDFYTDENWK